MAAWESETIKNLRKLRDPIAYKFCNLARHSVVKEEGDKGKQLANLILKLEIQSAKPAAALDTEPSLCTM